MSAKTIGGPAYLRRLPPTTTLANLPSMHTPFWYPECTVIIVIRMTPIIMCAGVYGASTDLRPQLNNVPQMSGTELQVTASDLR